MLTIKRLDLDDARMLIDGARAKAEEIGVPMAIAVTDESCNLIAFERMDGSKPPGTQFAIDKAFTATGTWKGTHELREACQPGQPAYGITASHGGRMVVLTGGLPIVVEGNVVGGIGVSSGSPDQDLAVAEAGIAALFGTT
ncbi:uncharacterized protein GlcG (DUF336 family) [Aliiruegeria haliotis]|uniref:Uncharacterized protein GlcG (DUF336 family) n=1 Tax=Aliiruegeria haliotis TaxID=1280846 RepID=A0A2T0RII4_9RHOB|nr:heme-binding protein [Aliiruegeria haliotis]PRY20937.1 uncharacterized protein GlcG (DUF336 family) [Aliiruegeria haliotis]